MYFWLTCRPHWRCSAPDSRHRGAQQSEALPPSTPPWRPATRPRPPAPAPSARSVTPPAHVGGEQAGWGWGLAEVELKPGAELDDHVHDPVLPRHPSRHHPPTEGGQAGEERGETWRSLARASGVASSRESASACSATSSSSSRTHSSSA
eukprot:655208-Rhodomonas_salina.1